jgi:hypothetical protein
MSFGAHNVRYRDTSHRDRSTYPLPSSHPPWPSGHQLYARTTTPTISRSRRGPTGPTTRLSKRTGVIIGCEYWRDDKVQLPLVEFDLRRVFYILKGSLLTLSIYSVVNFLKVILQYDEVFILTDASLDLGRDNVPIQPTTLNIVGIVFFRVS